MIGEVVDFSFGNGYGEKGALVGDSHSHSPLFQKTLAFSDVQITFIEHDPGFIDALFNLEEFIQQNAGIKMFVTLDSIFQRG